MAYNINKIFKRLHLYSTWRKSIGGGKTYRNILTTFLLGGLWHGAGWTFVVWGVLHGIALVVYRIWKSLGFRLNFIIAWFLTFNFVNISWVFFRSETFEQAISLLKRMFQFNDTGFESLKLFIGPGVLIRGFMDILLIILSLFIVVYFKNSNQLLQDFKPSYKKVLMVALFLGLSIIFLGSPSEFLYFRF